MANFHLGVDVISRGKGRSIAKAASYINGKRLHDNYNGTTYYKNRQNVLYYDIFQPVNAPPEFYNLQKLCDEINKAENRYDARTAREFKGSLPNELPVRELVQIVSEYVNSNFIDQGLCAIAAIHEGRNEADPLKNNPPMFILLYLLVLSNRMDLAKRRIVSMTIKNILISGGNNGRMYRIGLMNEMS